MNPTNSDVLANSLVTKRDDPNYAQVSGYIPKELARQFKILCTAEEVSQSDALEEAVKLWLAKRESSSGELRE